MAGAEDHRRDDSGSVEPNSSLRTEGNVLFARLLRACLPLLLLLLAAPAQAAEKGTVPDVTWGTSRSDVDRTVALMSDAGVQWARLNASWAAIEPNGDDSYDPAALADLDYAVAKVRAAGIGVVMPVADSVPFWASGDPAKVVDLLGRQWNTRYRPARMADYADFFAFVAARYGPRGVHVYEVWNEPNLLHFWPSGVNAAEYKVMLQSAYGAIKAAEPRRPCWSADCHSTTATSSADSTRPAGARTSTRSAITRIHGETLRTAGPTNQGSAPATRSAASRRCAA